MLLDSVLVVILRERELAQLHGKWTFASKRLHHLLLPNETDLPFVLDLPTQTVPLS